VTYAAEAGVPVILDTGGEELKHAVGHGPDLVVAETSAAEPDSAALGTALIRLAAGAPAPGPGRPPARKTGITLTWRPTSGFSAWCESNGLLRG
jgi:hypothetical protein